jgi:AraC-like DNA-binding protein
MKMAGVDQAGAHAAKPPGPSVSASYAKTLIEFAASRGARPGALLDCARIAPAALADPDHRIALTDLKSLMRAAAAQCADPAFALHFGESPILYDTTIVGLIIRSSETMGEAIREFRRYARLVMEVDAADGPDRFALSPDGAGVLLEDRRPDPNDFPEITEATFARFICDALRQFPGRPSFFRAVFVTHAAPGHAAEYERVLKAPTTFGAHRNAVLFDAGLLTARLPTANRYTFNIFSAHADSLLKSLNGVRSTKGEVERILASNLHKGDARMATVAAAMRMSAPTLYRKLRKEGARYDALLDALRRRMAVDYLSSGGVSVNETAYLLGFSDPAAFSRAFKRWTGASPRDVKADPRALERPDA